MLTPEELIEAYQGRAGLLARAILFDITTPEGAISPAILITLSQTLIDELNGYKVADFLKRFPRALKWAIREDIPPEIAIITIQQVFALRVQRPTMRAKVTRMPEYKAYFAKYGALISEAGF